MNKDPLYTAYAKLNDEIAALEAQREGLRTKILETLIAENIEKDQTTVGTFSVAHKTTWAYSPAVKAMDEKLKIKKIQEQKKGIAVPKKDPYLMFRENGQEEDHKI